MDTMESNLDFQRLVEALRILGETDRSVMLLYLEDYSYEEIGEIVGITPGNVGVKINRAKKQLKKHLTEGK
ncbi:MAG: sigma-70 family RNA polymerase sigma factor [Bacteroides sp.]|nr:sigma-70 family RNA polymerase sigma factor [Bacteroides sp.]